MALTRPRAYQIYDLDYKQATRVVTTTNITVAGGAPNSVDGVTLSLNDRILVTGQTSGSQNGVYYVTTLGTGSNGTWARSTDTNNTGELLSGTIIMVTEGVIYADTQWKLITDDPIVIGSSTLTFVQNYSANSISSGTSNVTVLSNSSVLISSAGTANVAKFDSTNVTFTANLLPVSNVTYSLGTTTQRWSNLWLSNSTIYLGNVNLSASDTTLTVNGANVLTGNAGAVFSTSGNIVGGNILTGGYVSATGNVTGNYIIGNGSQLTGLPASYSNTNVSSFLAAFGSNTISTTGTITAGNITGGNLLTGGLISATGNLTGGNILTGGLISATSTITSAANITGGNLLTGGLISATGNLTVGNLTTYIANVTTINSTQGASITGTLVATSANAQFFNQTNGAGYFTVAGYLSAVGNITGGNILTGGIASATGNITGGNILTAGLLSVTGNITGGNIIGGANVNATTHTGTTVSVSANITGGNILTGGLISATSIITGSTLLAGGISLTGNSITSTNATITIDPNSAGGVDGAVVIAGNLSVQGNVTYIDSNVITTNEKSITLGNNQNTGTALDGAGIDIGNNNLAYWRFNNATTSWQSNIGLTPVANATLNLGGTSNYWATLYTNAVQSGTTVSAVSNIAGGNILTAGLISATSNITGGNVLTGGQLSATGTITSNGATNGTAFAVGNSAVSNVALGMFPTAGTAGEYAIRDYSNVATNMYLDVGIGGTANGSFRFRTTNAFTTLANINSTGITTPLAVSATGNITGNYFIGNGSQLTGIVASAGAAITNGTSNVTVAASGNVTVGVAGTAAVATFTTTGIVANSIAATNNGNATNFKVGDDAWLGDINTVDTIGIRGQQNAANAYIVFGNADNTQLGRAGSGPLTYGGAFSATGNVTGGNLLFGTGIVSGTGNVFATNLTGTLQTASQTNITSVGTLGALTVTANITGGNILTGGLISATGNITGGNVLGGANVNATTHTGTTVSVTANITGGNILTGGLISATGNITGGNILSNGLLSVVGNIIQDAANSYVAWSDTAGATAAGTAQANAYAINTTSTQFTTVASGSGARLPVASAGQIAFVANDAANAVLLYPPTGGVIDQATANTAVTVSGLGMWMGIALNSTNWTTISPDTAGTTNQITVTQGNGIVTLALASSPSVSGNITGGNILTAGLISATSTITSAANITGGNILTAGIMSSTGNGIHGNILTGGLVSATGNVTGGNILTAGLISATSTVTSAANIIGGNITTAGLITATGNIQGGNLRTVGLISATGAITGAAITGSSLTVSTGNVTLGNIVNANANGVGNIGSAALYFNTVFAKATSAQYADLAEMYVADADYPAGTVVEFSGEYEITVSKESHTARVAGIISTHPSYLMNSAQQGTHVLPVALTGRVPCRVVGTIYKGDRLVASGLYSGVATGLNKESYEPGCIIGKALEDYSSTEVGIIEVAVGRF